MSDPSLSEIRRRLMAEHDGVRRHLTALEGALDTGTERATLWTLAEALTRELLRHLDEEERLLRPVLATLDAWGPLRLQLMDEEHTSQRQRVQLLEGLHVSQSATLPAELRAFITDLKREMAGEEKDVLHASLLRDAGARR